MARLNVWVPDELAARARSEGLNVSAMTQSALSDELAARDLDTWLDSLPEPRGDGMYRAGDLSPGKVDTALARVSDMPL
jgi:post-segregation antitoxin (ccd killing protein)